MDNLLNFMKEFETGDISINSLSSNSLYDANSPEKSAIPDKSPPRGYDKTLGKSVCFGSIAERYPQQDLYVLKLDLVASGQEVTAHASLLDYGMPLEVGDQVKVFYALNGNDDDEEEEDGDDNVRKL